MAAVVTVVLAADGRAWVDDHEVAASGVEAARRMVRETVRRIAAERRRPVTVAATEPDGSTHAFTMDSDGRIMSAAEERRAAADPDAVQAPEALRGRLEAIVAAAESGRTAIAVRLAELLVAEQPEGHRHALRAREVLAHVLHVAGRSDDAAEEYLTVAQEWHAAGSSTAYGAAVRRAYAVWRTAQGERGRLVWLGERLAAVLALGLPDPHIRDARAMVLRRVDRLSAD